MSQQDDLKTLKALADRFYDLVQRLGFYSLVGSMTAHELVSHFMAWDQRTSVSLIQCLANLPTQVIAEGKPTIDFNKAAAKLTFDLDWSDLLYYYRQNAVLLLLLYKNWLTAGHTSLYGLDPIADDIRHFREHLIGLEAAVAGLRR